MLDVSIVNVALPSIERSLHAGPTQLQLIVAGYTLAFGLALVPAGRLGDVHGRRVLFVAGLAAFGLTSLGAGLASSDVQLSVCRLIQGAAAGVLNPQVAGVIQQMFKGAPRARAFGLFGGVAGLATAIGPLIGGVLIAVGGPVHGWRLVFFVNVLVAAPAAVAAARLLPSAAAQSARGDATRGPADGIGQRDGCGADGSGIGQGDGRDADGSGIGQRAGRGADGSGIGLRDGRGADGSGIGQRAGRGADGSGIGQRDGCGAGGSGTWQESGDGRGVKRAPARMDWTGVLLIGLAVVAFMAPFVLSGDRGADMLGAQRWLSLVLVAGLIPLLWWWEGRYQRRFRAAVINPALLHNSGFRYGAAVGLGFFAALTSIMLVVTLVLQRGLGYSALEAGLVVIPGSIASATASWFAGKLVLRLGRRLVVLGVAVAGIGLVATEAVLRLAPDAWVGPALALTMCITAGGSGIVVAPNQSLTLARIPRDDGGTAGAVLQVAQRVGACIGLAVVLAGFFTERASHGARIAAADALLASIAINALTLIIAIADARRAKQEDPGAGGPSGGGAGGSGP
jgi:MFS family permease